MKFNFQTLEAERTDRWNAWLNGFIVAEVVALILLVGYCLAHTF